MANNNQLTVVNDNIKAMKGLVRSDSMKKRMEDVLGKEAGTFLASALDLYTSDTNLSRCDANRVMAECMKAAALKLPISKSLGFCYIIPYGDIPQFQLGYKGYIQLAQRTGQYRYINADMVYEGEVVTYNRITGMMEIGGAATSNKPIGYFAYFQLLNGFEKAIYWTREKVEAHAKQFSKAWKQANSPWHQHFDAMALKTVIKQLISKYGIMSVEFANAVSGDDYDDRVEAEVAANANGDPVVIPERKEPAQLQAPQGETEAEQEPVPMTADEAVEAFSAEPEF